MTEQIKNVENNTAVENKTMNKRVYGVCGIKNRMAMWNASFEKYARELEDGTAFATDKALKYAIRNKWKLDGETLLATRCYKLDGGKVTPMSLEERYTQLFGAVAKTVDPVEIYKQLFGLRDIKNFGVAFAVKERNASITGAVQIGLGINKLGIPQQHNMQILAPYRNAGGDSENTSEKQAFTNGTQVVVEKAEYLYDFSIIPQMYQDYVDLGLTEGYTEEDYENFKEALRLSATTVQSASKKGVDTSFIMYVETKPDYYLQNLGDYFKYTDNGETIEIEFTDKALLENNPNIEKIEVLFDDKTYTLKGFPGNTEYKNIYTLEELKVGK